MEADYTAYSRQVYAYVRTLGASVHEAEDVTQETFLRAVKGLDGFRGDCSMPTWLCRIARNVFLSERRRSGRFTDADPDTPVADPDVVGRLADRESARQVHRALHELGEPYKEVFSLRALGELPFAEIASIFGRTESWARVTYHRAKLHLRKELE
ncbi:RNA polymerase sigma factor [Raineyella sp.]|uniref:RNA polymerase sigma factor YlaC n=1 Tax=bioreactor metagenome TaxID=1076179 RepID=A0A644Z8K4_9ZZZZ|nr:RNA polymerase sigma factor [Raineyella sp.]MEA5153216.1 RNA polymerase sigma factor [Raineyella sp.]